MNAIEIKGLKKSFRGMYALNGLDMTVPVGSIYGFIGENGSGKSTTEKLICGHLVKDSGSIKLFGKNNCHYLNTVNSAAITNGKSAACTRYQSAE